MIDRRAFLEALVVVPVMPLLPAEPLFEVIEIGCDGPVLCDSQWTWKQEILIG